jgi:hypothetical protein
MKDRIALMIKQGLYEAGKVDPAGVCDFTTEFMVGKCMVMVDDLVMDGVPWIVVTVSRFKLVDTSYRCRADEEVGSLDGMVEQIINDLKEEGI